LQQLLQHVLTITTTLLPFSLVDVFQLKVFLN